MVQCLCFAVLVAHNSYYKTILGDLLAVHFGLIVHLNTMSYINKDEREYDIPFKKVTSPLKSFTAKEFAAPSGRTSSTVKVKSGSSCPCVVSIAS